MKTMKKLLGVMVLLIMVAGTIAGCGSKGTSDGQEQDHDRQTQSQSAEESTKENAAVQNGILKDDIVILFTTDVHSKLTDYIGYDGAAAYKKEAEAVCGGDRVLLVDCGDCLDGCALGEETSGQAIVSIMNQAGYDIAVPGNHDFKYTVENLKKLAKQAEFCYLSCNLREISTGTPVLEPYTIVEKGGRRLAFIGVTTSQSTFTKQEYGEFSVEQEDGSYTTNPRYDFMEKELYARVQKVIDEVRSQNVDYVILLTHLGYNNSENSSTELIARTTGVDAVIDGHAHEEIEMEQLANAQGEPVIQTSAGELLKNIGQLTIDQEGNITTKLVKVENYLEKDAETTKYIQNLKEMHESED